MAGRKRNPTCPKCGATMFWDSKRKQWYCTFQNHHRS